MEKSKVDQFIMVNADKFPEVALMQIREKIENSDESKESALLSMPMKSPMVCLVLAIIFGGFGADRFYMGEIGLGVIKLLTCGGLGVWSLIDIFTAMGRAKQYNFRQLAMRL